jgi:heat shock protein HslJ
MMACPDPVMAQATAYQAALTAASTFAIDSGILTLMDANGVTVLSYEAVAQALSGTSWQAIMFNNGKSAIVGVNGVQITANFGTDGQISGFSGCNNYSGTYLAPNNTISFGPMISTQKACTEPKGVMEQESQYLAALASATTFAIQGQLLEMQSSTGESAVQFQRVGP